MIKYLIFILFILQGQSLMSQSFYDLNTVQTIEITFAESNWDDLLDAQKAGDENYIMAQMVSINGIEYDSVGVKYKGNSTYNRNQAKNPFHIELDTYKDHKHEAYTDIKLSNVAKDPSFIREVLSYQVLRQYMDAPLSNYANVYVNGTLLGLYSNSESVSKKFVNSRFGSKSNAFIKCNPPAGAGPQSNDLPNLVYLGQDSTAYYDAYEIKSDGGWQELINLCDTLNNHVEDIEQLLDIDRVLWMHAFNNVLVNLDSYSGGFAQNYYLYKDDYGRFLPVVWDLNESFGQFAMTGSGNLRDTRDKQELTHLLHENDNDYPLIQKLLNVPTYKRMYLAHIKTMLEENFQNESYAETGQTFQTLIDKDVQADNNKFFTYNNFLDNLSSDINSGGGPGGGGPGGGSTPGITNLMDGRSAYLLGLSDFTATQPNIADITLSNALPTVGEVINITANATSANNVYIAFRISDGGPFTKIEMYDDGAHNDSMANDGIYGTSIAVTGKNTEYYIYAENNNIGRFAPRRAQHEFYTINASSNTILGDVVINEFMASNNITVTDQDNEYEDWIELYNKGAQAVNISGYYLTDDAQNLTQWEVPAGTIIEPDSYLIIWADNDTDQEGLHANFKLSASAEEVLLIDTDGTTILDEVGYTEQTSDISYGRIPNGTGDFQATSPTFNANNDIDQGCTNSGGDADNDGICANEDCDDNDSNVGAQEVPGTPCDDANPDTSDDIILADGCTCQGTQLGTSPVVINELMASNDATVTDQDGEYEDWIELYNNGNTSIDLGGYYLTDDETNPTQWTFPANTIIEANSYLIIWADDDTDQEGLHANFKLSAGGETLWLIDPSANTILDSATYEDLDTDTTYGRFPNGTGDFRKMIPTFNSENSSTSNTSDITNIEKVLIFPNPASSVINISSTQELIELSVYNLEGREVLTARPNMNAFKIGTESLNSGIYYIVVLTANDNIHTSKIIINK